MKRLLSLSVSLLLFIPILMGLDIGDNIEGHQTIKVEDGMTQPVFSSEEAIIETVYVETTVDSDGDGEYDKVRADLIRPKETEDGLKVPVIYEMSPYRAGLNPIDFHDVDVELNPVDDNQQGGIPYAQGLPGYYDDYFVPRGYAVILAEGIGSGLSDGCPTTGDEQEILATKAVVDWLNGNAKAYDEDGEEVLADWSTGKVGMTGVSYNGTLPNGLATTGVEGLETIVPIGAISSWYDYYRANGAVIAPGGYQGEDADSLARAVLTRNNSEVCEDMMNQIEESQDRLTGDYNEFWDERNYLNNAQGIEASVFVVHGLNDWNVKTKQFSQWWDALEENDVPRKLWLHQNGHSSPYSFRTEEWLTTLNKWFDYWLYDIDNDVMDEPMVDIQRQDESWETEENWPNPDAKDSTLYLAANSNEDGGLRYRPVKDSGQVNHFSDDSSKAVDELIQDPLSHVKNRDVYLSSELTNAYRLSGTVDVSIRASIDRPVANLTALLVDYGPDEAKIVTRGWLDPQNYNSISESEAIIPNKQYTFEWDMQPEDYEFKEGHKIGLVIVSSDYDYTIRPEPGTNITVYPEQSHITLPLVGDITKEPKSIENMKELIEFFDVEGEFESSETVRMLQTHLNSVQHYEDTKKMEKVIKHLNGFKIMLDYQLEGNLISDDAYHILIEDTDALLNKWQ